MICLRKLLTRSLLKERKLGSIAANLPYPYVLLYSSIPGHWQRCNQDWRVCWLMQQEGSESKVRTSLVKAIAQGSSATLLFCQGAREPKQKSKGHRPLIHTCWCVLALMTLEAISPLKPSLSLFTSPS